MRMLLLKDVDTLRHLIFLYQKLNWDDKTFPTKPQIEPHSIPDPGLLLPHSLLFIKYAFWSPNSPCPHALSDVHMNNGFVLVLLLSFVKKVFRCRMSNLAVYSDWWNPGSDDGEVGEGVRLSVKVMIYVTQFPKLKRWWRCDQRQQTFALNW